MSTRRFSLERWEKPAIAGYAAAPCKSGRPRWRCGSHSRRLCIAAPPT
ncbi:hypothetical protein [Pyrobaculum sp.]